MNRLNSAAIAIVALSFFANFLNYMDRFLVSVVLPEIKTNFMLTEFQAGALWTAFTVGFLISAPFVGYLADRYSKPKIFGICVIIWSMATILCAYSTTYKQLIALRTLIGIGEAGCLAIAPAILSEMFSKDIRGKILSIFYAGFPLGATFAYLFGGWVNVRWGWETVFILAGVPGIPTGIGLMLCKAHPFGNKGLNKGWKQKEANANSGEKTSIKGYVTLLKNLPFLLISFSQAIITFSFIPLVHWGIDFFANIRGINQATITYSFGISAMFAGVIGSGLGGYLGDKLNKKTNGGYILLCAISLLLGFPFIWMALNLSTLKLIIICIFLSFLSFYTFLPSINAQLASIVHEKRRAMAFALSVFVLHVFGDTISPLIFGRLSDIYSKELMFKLFVLLVPLSSLICFVCYFIIKKGNYNKGD